MSESEGNTQPAAPAPSYKKKGGKSKMIVIVTVALVLAFVAGMLAGGVVFKEEKTGGLLDRIIEKGELVVGTNTPWPPFEDYDSVNDTYIGVDMDIVKRIASELGVTLVIKQMDFDALIGAVQSGQIDIAISSFTITASRLESVDFSTPYYIANQAVLVKDSSSIATISDLNNTDVDVTAQMGTTGDYWIQDNLVASETAYDSIASAISSLDNGYADAAVLDTPVAYKYANSTAYDFKIAFIIPTDEEYGIVIPKDNGGLKYAIDDIITEMIADGSMQDIYNTWL